MINNPGQCRSSAVVSIREKWEVTLQVGSHAVHSVNEVFVEEEVMDDVKH